MEQQLGAGDQRQHDDHYLRLLRNQEGKRKTNSVAFAAVKQQYTKLLKADLPTGKNSRMKKANYVLTLRRLNVHAALTGYAQEIVMALEVTRREEVRLVASQEIIRLLYMGTTYTRVARLNEDVTEYILGFL